MSFVKVLKDTIKMVSSDKRKINKEIKEEAYDTFLDNPNSKKGRMISFFIFALIFLSIGLMIFESVGDNASSYFKILFFADAIISTIFAIEYFYRLNGAKNKSKFVGEGLNIIDLLAFLPFFLELVFGSLLNLTFLKILRLLRIFRIFKLVKKLAIIEPVLISIKEHKLEYQIGTALFLMMLLIASVFMYTIEGGSNEGFNSIPAAFWWSIVTMTTVGYGDVYPITVLGKIVGSFVIFLGPMFVAMLSSITVIIFMEVATINRALKDRSNVKKVYKICNRCKNKSNDKGANYCKVCGEVLE